MNAAIFALKVLISKVYIKFLFSLLENFVPKEGLEPSRLSTHAPKACVSTIPPPGHALEPTMGFEPTTSSLPRKRSTTEL